MPKPLTELFGAAKRSLVHFGTTSQRIIGAVAQIESGPGKGLRFDAGADTHRFASGQYERPVQEALAKAVRPGSVCYDIGANLGFFSVLLAHLAGPTGSIYAFEPLPANAAMIERNALLNRFRNVRVFKLALSRVDGQEELLVAHHVGGAVLKSAGAPPDLAGSLTVKTAALDTLVDREQVNPPNFVKIDVEGAELDVLYGMRKVLQNWHPTLIMELDDESAIACEKKVSLCQSFLSDLGYRTEFLTNSYPDGGWFVLHFLAVSSASTIRG
jgi:FkbM family methyltransferase